MGWFGYNSATKKSLKDFPSGWTGEDIIKFIEDVKSAGITANLEFYDGFPAYVSFCSGDACALYKAGYTMLNPVDGSLPGENSMQNQGTELL
jgi:hypothetical protein